jgi:uroporphyrinogen-III synthase
MDKTILITRPQGDEHGLVSTLQSSGYHIIHEPLMEIMLRHHERYNVHRALMEEPDAILVTSRHGVKALAILTEIRDPFVICVGEATARAAESAGFLRTSTAGGSARQLMEHVLSCYDESSRFVYISGDHVNTDLGEELGQAGMRVERIIAYEANAAETLSDTLVEQLRRKQVDGVTFLSQRTARIFMSLLEQQDLTDSTEGMHAFCMSQAVADTLERWPWQGIHVAQNATLASIVKSIDNVFLTNG